jgi:ribosomal protein L34
VDPAIFEQAQQIIKRFTWNRSDQELLDNLRSILTKYGKITTELLQQNATTPRGPTYRARFGSLSRAYQLIGYSGFWCDDWLQRRRHIQELRTNLMKEIVELNPKQVVIERRRNGYRARLRTRHGRLISVVASRTVPCYNHGVYWLVRPRPDECRLITLVARLNLQSDTFKDMFLIPPVGTTKDVYLKERDQRLQKFIHVTDLEDFCGTVERLISRQCKIFQ